MMEAEGTSKTGAGLGKRSPERLTHRNRYRYLSWDTRVGTIDLRISTVREGISKSQVSRICSELDGGPYPDWWMR